MPGADSPFQRLPPLAVGLASLILAIEAAFQLGARGLLGGPGAVGWRIEAMTLFGLSSPLLRQAAEIRTLDAGALLRLGTYPFIHLGATHAVFGAVLTLALGKAVSERFSAGAMTGILVAGAFGGALSYVLFFDGRTLLVGIYPAVYGMIGAYTWSLWMEREGRGRIMAFRLIGVLLVLQLIVRLTIGGGPEWIADLGGFAAGFAASFVLAPDGGARLRRLRDRARGR